MRQALHIFHKDVRDVRKELCAVIAIAMLYAWAATHSANSGWAELLLAIASAYVIARLIHAETIPGDRQFWITRPYNRSSLLLAKIVGIVILVNTPIFAARLYVLLDAGFPVQNVLAPLAWSQFLIFVGAMLPIAALASVTPGFVPFTFAAIILLALGFWIDERIAPPSGPAVRLLLTSSQWIWNSIAVATLAVASIPVLFVQYRTRRTLASLGIMLSVGIMGGLAYTYVPWPVGAGIQASLSQQGFDTATLEVGFEPSAKRFFPMGMMYRNGVQVDVPLALRGIPDDIEAIPDAVSLNFHAADGTAWATGSYIYPAVAKLFDGSGPARLNANVDVPHPFFDKARHHPIKVKGTLYLTLFGNTQSRTIPLQGKPVMVLNGLHCGMGMLRDLWCTSAFRWPARLVYAKFQNDEVRAFTRVLSYSPFPSGLGFDAVKSRQVSAPSGQNRVTIVVREPVAFLRRNFDIDNFPLAAFSTRVTDSKRRE